LTCLTTKGVLHFVGLLPEPVPVMPFNVDLGTKVRVGYAPR